jgi:hypothetical protein
MKLKARGLATITLTTLVLVAAGSLAKASQQMWNPDVAYAARVTASLLKRSSIRPILLPRSSHTPDRPIASVSLTMTKAKLATYTLKPSFSISAIEGTVRKQPHPVKQLEFQQTQE